MVVTLEPPSNLSSLHADDRIVACRVARLALENLHSNRSLFKKFLAAFELVLNNVGEELLAARTVPKGLAFEDTTELREDRRSFGVGEGGTFVMRTDDRFSCYSHGLNPWNYPLIMGSDRGNELQNWTLNGRFREQTLPPSENGCQEPFPRAR